MRFYINFIFFSITTDYSHFQHLSDPRDENNLIHSLSINQQGNSKNINEFILLRNENAFLKKEMEILQKKTDKLSQVNPKKNINNLL